MKKQFTCAVIGLGAIHMNHIRPILSCDEAKLIAVCDIKEDLVSEKARSFGCAGYTDAHEMIERERPDVVHLCLPHYLHKPMAVFAMQHGCHVLTEKPMGMNTVEVDEMIRVSEETGMRLGVCFQNRYNPTSVRIKEVLESGRMGDWKTARMIVTWNRSKAYYDQAEWRGTRAMEGGGVLINQAIHTMDLLQWYLGLPQIVSAQTASFRLRDVIEVEDTAHGYLTYAGGQESVFYATIGYGADAPIEIEIVLEGGRISLKKDLTIEYQNGTKEFMNNQSLASGAKGYWGKGHEALIHDYYKKLAENKPFPIDAKEGAKVIRMLTAIYQSANENGRAVTM